MLGLLLWGNLLLLDSPDAFVSDMMKASGGIALLYLLLRRNDQNVAAAIRRPEPPLIRRAVKFGIMSLVWLHVGLLLAVRGPIPAVAVAVFWFPAAYAGRWIYST